MGRFCPRVISPTSGDVFGCLVCVCSGESITGIQQVEARNAVKQPTMHRMTGPNVARAEVENPWSGL